ncbi:hypothetical protein [Parasediminibacterium sp. JCM 36343]|uniref:hypothetical protein n=1 Tax=Parasediminibacterium sp. JCM 36343 TaxID=3374279 RepID=UPI00397C7F7B
MNKQVIQIVCLLILAIAWLPSKAQFVTVSGTVYDITGRNPVEAIAVFSKSGRGTFTDSLGRYSFTVKAKDSIWFSLMNKSTMKYAIDTISNLSSFDISIHVRATDLPEVTVRSKSYRLDSLQNRRDYQKYFDFKKPGIKLSNNPGYNPGGLTVGLDLDEFINMFRFRRNRNLMFLQNRLIQQEQDKYVNFRFSKAMVHKITKLESPELDTFIKKYRPDYDLLQTFNDLEMGYYIEQYFKEYQIKRNRSSLKKIDD